MTETPIRFLSSCFVIICFIFLITTRNSNGVSPIYQSETIIGGWTNIIDDKTPALYYSSAIYQIRKPVIDFKLPDNMNREMIDGIDDIYCSTSVGVVPSFVKVSSKDGTLKLLYGAPSPTGPIPTNLPYKRIDAFFVRQVSIIEKEIYLIDSQTIKKLFNNGTAQILCGQMNRKGTIGDGGLAINAFLSDPTDLLVKNGEIFILDKGNYRVRKILVDGTIVTVAGNGNSPDSSVDINGKVATSVGIEPVGFVISDRGEIYINEKKFIYKVDLEGKITKFHTHDLTSGTLIRDSIQVVTVKSTGLDEIYFSTLLTLSKVSQNGTVTRLAGGISALATNSTMDGSSALNVAFRINHNMIVEIDSNDRSTILFIDQTAMLRKIDKDGLVWTIYGYQKNTVEYYRIPSKFSELFNGADITVNLNGEIIFNDEYSVRKILPNGGMDIIFSSSIDSSNNIPCRVGEYFKRDRYRTIKFEWLSALDNNNLVAIILPYIGTEPQDYLLLFIENGNLCAVPSGKTLDAGPALSAVLNDPRSLTIKNDVIYFVDRLNHKIKKIQEKNITTIAGTGEASFYGDDGPALNAALNFPSALAIGSDNSIYVADTKNNRIRKISPEGIITTIAGNGLQGFGGDDAIAINATLNQPHGVTVGKYDIFFSDSANHRIRQIDKYGLIRTIAGNGLAGYNNEDEALNTQLYFPTSIKVNSFGAIYFTDTNNHIVRIIHETYIGTIAGAPGIGGFNGNLGTHLLYPQDVQPCFGNDVLIADTSNDRVRRTYMHTVREVVSIQQDYLLPTSVFSTCNVGYHFTSNNRILYSSVEGKADVLAGGVGDGGLVQYSKYSLGGINSDLKGDVLIADSTNNRIRKISMSTGEISTVVGIGEYGYSGDNGKAIYSKMANPSGVFITPNGDIYIGDTANHRVRKVSAQTGIITTIAGTGSYGKTKDNILAKESYTNYPTKIFVNSAGEVFFIQEGYVDNQFMISPIKILRKISTNGTITTLASDITNMYGFPNGDVLVLKNSQILRFSPTCPTLFALSFDKTECIPLCFGVLSNSSSVCSSLGVCSGPDYCVCNGGYGGLNCSSPICTQTCKYGTCISPNKCDCQNGYYGDDCSKKMGDLTLALIGSGVGFIFILILAIVIPIIIFVLLRYRKKRIILKTDTSLGTRLLTGYDENTSTVHELDESGTESQSAFLIPLDKLGMERPIKRLGEGGMGCVFQTHWNNTIVAVKVFDLNNLDISEEDFKIEAVLLARLRHPNIITFFGVSFSPSKRYIVMECLEKSLESVLASLHKGKLKLNLSQKIKMLLDISKGVQYLHNLDRKIVHRDLKPANILLDKNGTCKLCDFGLSRALSNNTFSALTSHIGTCNYMAPEIVKDFQIERSEATAIDIFSFSIIMYQLLFDLKDPYLNHESDTLNRLRIVTPQTFSNMYHLHRCICEDNLRPKIPFTDIDTCKEWSMEFLDKFDGEHNSDILFELTELDRHCWEANPNQRPNIDQVIELLTQLDNQINQRINQLQ